jgi:hypothetical protein
MLTLKDQIKTSLKEAYDADTRPSATNLVVQTTSSGGPIAVFTDVGYYPNRIGAFRDHKSFDANYDSSYSALDVEQVLEELFPNTKEDESTTDLISVRSVSRKLFEDTVV